MDKTLNILKQTLNYTHILREKAEVLNTNT